MWLIWCMLWFKNDSANTRGEKNLWNKTRNLPVDINYNSYFEPHPKGLNSVHEIFTGGSNELQEIFPAKYSTYVWREASEASLAIMSITLPSCLLDPGSLHLLSLTPTFTTYQRLKSDKTPKEHSHASRNALLRCSRCGYIHFRARVCVCVCVFNPSFKALLSWTKSDCVASVPGDRFTMLRKVRIIPPFSPS